MFLQSLLRVHNIILFCLVFNAIQSLPQKINIPEFGIIDIVHDEESIKLISQQSKNLIATLNFSRTPTPETIHMSWLRVEKPYRRYGIGKLLFALFAHEMYQKKYQKITWTACPTDPEAGNTQETQLPKLLKFYLSIGGIILDKSIRSAFMEYDLNHHPHKNLIDATARIGL